MRSSLSKGFGLNMLVFIPEKVTSSTCSRRPTPAPHGVRWDGLILSRDNRASLSESGDTLDKNYEKTHLNHVVVHVCPR
jgi:hypothetical protein